MATTGKKCRLTTSSGYAQMSIKQKKELLEIMIAVPLSFVLVFSSATAVARSSGYRPPWSPWSHPGMCRDNSRSVQTGNSDQQVRQDAGAHYKSHTRHTLDKRLNKLIVLYLQLIPHFIFWGFLQDCGGHYFFRMRRCVKKHSPESK